MGIVPKHDNNLNPKRKSGISLSIFALIALLLNYLLFCKLKYSPLKALSLLFIGFSGHSGEDLGAVVDDDCWPDVSCLSLDHSEAIFSLCCSVFGGVSSMFPSIRAKSLYNLAYIRAIIEAMFRMHFINLLIE